MTFRIMTFDDVPPDHCIFECEECGDEYTEHALELPPHLCAECTVAAEDRFDQGDEA